jgi:hypothetical protein
MTDFLDAMKYILQHGIAKLRNMKGKLDILDHELKECEGGFKYERVAELWRKKFNQMIGKLESAKKIRLEMLSLCGSVELVLGNGTIAK